MAKTKHEVTQRKAPCEMRAMRTEDGRYTIEGLAAVYDEHTLIAEEWDEVITRGAFDDADITDIVLLVNHDWDGIALARTKNGKGTMKVWTEDDGLHFKVDSLDVENNAEARSIYSAIERGDMSGVSIAFVIADGGQTWDYVRNATEAPYEYRTISKIARVHEISIVNFPAYDGTSVKVSRSEQESLKEMEETRNRSQMAEMLRMKNANDIHLILR